MDEVSHELATDKSIFHFRYAFHWKLQPIFWCKSCFKNKQRDDYFNYYLESSYLQISRS